MNADVGQCGWVCVGAYECRLNAFEYTKVLMSVGKCI